MQALPRPPTSAGLRKLDSVDARLERLRDMMLATRASLSSGLDGQSLEYCVLFGGGNHNHTEPCAVGAIDDG